jgi:two-component system CheB/CheR fusion protein
MNESISARLRVLVVDDHKDCADSQAVLVDLWGYEVRVCYDAATALNVAGDFRPDVVLLDISMPSGGGYEIARQLRQKSELLLVAISGHGDAQHKSKASDSGVVHYLVKPADPDTLEELLAHRQRLKNSRLAVANSE